MLREVFGVGIPKGRFFVGGHSLLKNLLTKPPLAVAEYDHKEPRPNLPHFAPCLRPIRFPAFHPNRRQSFATRSKRCSSNPTGALLPASPIGAASIRFPWNGKSSGVFLMVTAFRCSVLALPNLPHFAHCLRLIRFLDRGRILASVW